MTVVLADHCLSVPGCTRPRLTYAGYCSEHGPVMVVNAPPKCQKPIRCYCWTCSPPKPLGPNHGPETVRAMLDELARRRSVKAEQPTRIAP